MIFFKLLPSMISVQSVPSWILEPLNIISLFIEGIIYQFVTYTYKLFSIMCSLNFNSLSAIVAPLMDRFKALIIVLVLFKLGMMLINMMMRADDIVKPGKELIINIFITAALLICNNFIFTVLNEVSMLFLGTPDGYNYTVLNEIAGVSGGKDAGIIMRFVFGEDQAVDDIGDFIAFQTAGIFIQNTGSQDELAAAVIEANGQYNFLNLHKINSKIGKTVEYTPLAGIAISGFLVYTFLNICAEIGIRMFKLLVLQMMAPLAIITIIKDGWKGNTMQSFIKEYTSIYIQAFVRILSTLVVTVIVAKTSTNLGSFFGTAWNAGDTGITKGLILAIVIFSAYKFVLEIPKLIDSLFHTSLASSSGKGGFSSFLAGTVIGGATGLATGAIGGVTSAMNSGRSGFWGNTWSAVQGAAGGLAGGVAGLAQGVYSGSKGNSIAENIKNGYKVREKTKSRSENWYQNGGMLNAGMHAAVAGASNFTGITSRQDRKMAIYDEQEKAINAYEEAINKAQIDTIKNTTTGSEDLFDMKGYGDQEGQIIQRKASEIYSDGYENIKLGDNADSYVQQMLEFDKEYQEAQAQLSVAQKGEDANAIATATAKLRSQKQFSEKRAKEYWEKKKSSANYDQSKVSQQKALANRALSKTGTQREATTDIDIKTEKNNIKTNKSNMQNKVTYKQTHKNNK